MIRIEWDDKYSVGHERIDHEHQVFLDLIINASRADEEQLPREKVLRLLNEIKKYAEFHFYSEENIMLDNGYPGYESHRQEHIMLLCNLDNKFHNYRFGLTSLTELVEFMFEWFALHTTYSDKKLAAYIDHP